MTRREFIRRLACASAAPVLWPSFGCAPAAATSAPIPSVASSLPSVDASFASLALAYTQQPSPAVRAQLRADPALAMLQRHTSTGGQTPSPIEELLERVLAQTAKSGATSAVLDAWRGRDAELAAYAERSAATLPAGAARVRTIFLVTGYDIGVAAPPDVALNVVHPHFVSAPAELGFYATHEAFHVGFFGFRPFPSVSELADARHLRDCVAYNTQNEGMAVHAAYAGRAQAHALGSDADYAIYTDAEARRRVARRYDEMLAAIALEGPVADDVIGKTLESLSSGERLSYRFGALVAWSLEQARGREGLIASIAAPEAFEAVADTLRRDLAK